jgi:type IV secretion system protein VirB3
MIADQAADKDRLAVPDTRPQMFLFVPYELAILFGMAFFATDTFLHSMVDGFIVLPLWAIAALLVKRDVNGVRVFMVRFRLLMLLLDAHRWGGLSASPWPLNAREDRGAI